MRREWLVILLLCALGVGLLVFREKEPELIPAGTGDASKVSVQPVDRDGLEKEIRTHKGKPILVEFWATWCGPCRSEFPKFVAIHERYGERGLVCISVALEHQPEADTARALSFLKNQHATSTNFVWTERTDRGQEGLEKTFGYPGSIPYAALFNRDGERIAPEDGTHFSSRELIQRIESELEKKP